MIFYALFVCSRYFFSMSLSKSALSTFYFEKLLFIYLCLISSLFSWVLNSISYLQNYDIYITIVYISAIWPSVFSLYKNYFLFIKIRFWHMLVKTCFRRGFELIKNYLWKKMRNSHKRYEKIRLINEILRNFKSINFLFEVWCWYCTVIVEIT